MPSTETMGGCGAGLGRRARAGAGTRPCWKRSSAAETCRANSFPPGLELRGEAEVGTAGGAGVAPPCPLRAAAPGSHGCVAGAGAQPEPVDSAAPVFELHNGWGRECGACC